MQGYYLLFCCIDFNAEVLVLGILVVVLGITFHTAFVCMLNAAVVLEPGKM